MEEVVSLKIDGKEVFNSPLEGVTLKEVQAKMKISHENMKSGKRRLKSLLKTVKIGSLPVKA